jgi:protein-tyrosine phosphatase
MRESSLRFRTCLYLAAVAAGALALANAAFANEVPFERVITLKGTMNTRDIGGYPTEQLRAIRPGQIIRSERLSRLTEGDFRKLEEIGVKTVIDLRTDEEVADAPTVWKGDHPPRIHHVPVVSADHDWFESQSRMMKRGWFSPEQSLAHMVKGYQVFAEEGAESYEQVMDLVRDESNWPILIHCSAGKDRSGIAVALIMEAVGVDRDTIMEDYLFTNDIGRSQRKAELLAREGTKYSRRGPSADAWYPIVGVQAEMLEAFYASVEATYGSMDAYLEELGIDGDARSALVESLTEPAMDLAMGE